MVDCFVVDFVIVVDVIVFVVVFDDMVIVVDG